MPKDTSVCRDWNWTADILFVVIVSFTTQQYVSQLCAISHFIKNQMVKCDQINNCVLCKIYIFFSFCPFISIKTENMVMLWAQAERLLLLLCNLPVAVVTHLLDCPSSEKQLLRLSAENREQWHIRVTKMNGFCSSVTRDRTGIVRIITNPTPLQLSHYHNCPVPRRELRHFENLTGLNSWDHGIFHLMLKYLTYLVYITGSLILTFRSVRLPVVICFPVMLWKLKRNCSVN